MGLYYGHFEIYCKSHSLDHGQAVRRGQGRLRAAARPIRGEGVPGADEGENAEAVRATIEAMAGRSGLMLFETHDHGSLLRIVGLKRKAFQYVVGNPLIAIQMTRHVIGAGLYAPLRVLLYEDEEGNACMEYDRPSSIFGQFSDDRIALVAASLDQKLEDLAATAMR